MATSSMFFISKDDIAGFAPKCTAILVLSLVNLLAACSSGGSTDTVQPADSIAPQNARVDINEGAMATVDRAVTLSMSASDDVGIVAYYASEDNIAPLAGSAGWVAVSMTTLLSTEVSFTLSEETVPGTYLKTVYVWFIDGSDNISDMASDSIELQTSDTNPPNAQDILINNDAASTDTVDVTATLTARDDVGVTAYLLSESPIAPSLSSTGWNSISPTAFLNTDVAFTLGHEGAIGDYTKTVYAWYRDDSGNISSPSSDEILLTIFDTRAPYSNSVSINGGDASTSTATVMLTLEAYDDIGVTHYFVSENQAVPDLNDSAWALIDVPSVSYSSDVTFSFSATSGTKTVYAWFRDGQGNLSAMTSDSILLMLPSAIDLGSDWMFLGDSQTGGRANEDSAISHAIAFRNVWNQTFSDTQSPYINGVGGRTLQGTYDFYTAASNKDSASWVHFQESGYQDSSQDTTSEFIATFDAMANSIASLSPAAVISTETAYSFEAESEPGRDWTQYNIEMRATVDNLRSNGVVVHLVEVDRNIKELVSRKRAELGAAAGQEAVWGDTDNTIARHYTGLGNLMIALSMFDALGYDLDSLDMSAIPDIEVSQSDKQLCIEIITSY